MRDIILNNAPGSVAIGGLLIGFFFGWIVFRTNFCTMGSISDFMSFGDFRRFRAWILAIATAMIGTQLLNAYGIVDLSHSMYVSGKLDWFGNIIGGFLFGVGMVFAGGCASRNLARAGGGDLRSLLVLIVIGLFAYISIGGLLGPVRADVSARTSIDLTAAGGTTIPSLLAQAFGLSASTAALIATAVIAGIAILYCLSDPSFRSSQVHIFAGIGIGLCVIAGWALTGLAYDDMAAQPISPVSLTFVRPAGDTLEWFERFTAGPVPSFAVTTTLGAILGALVASVTSGRFRLTTFANPADTIRNLFGAALMGIGGVMALGCTIGQGVTGVSTLALGSLLTFAAIVTGGMFGIKRMEAILLAEV